MKKSDLNSPLAKGAGGLILINMTDSHYNKGFKHLARNLRTYSTPGEIILWNNVLKNKKMHGYQFLRQFSIDTFIVDFVCRKIKLIIEVDGYSHNFKFENDIQRDEYLTKLGFTIIRFSENEIKNDFPNVLRTIENKVLQHNN